MVAEIKRKKFYSTIKVNLKWLVCVKNFYGAFNKYFSGYDDKFKGVCGMLLNDHDFYEGNLKTTGKLTNCVLSFNVQGSVYTVLSKFPQSSIKF